MVQSRGSARTSGLILAFAVGGVFAATVGVIAWRGLSVPKAPTVKQVVPRAPDVKEIPSGAGGLRQLGGGKGMQVQMVDRKDPGRVAGVLEAESSTPLEGKRYRMDKPRVWMYMRDGRTMYLEGAKGEALIPDLGSRPEDGLLEGDVIVKMFAAMPGNQKPDPLVTPPMLTLATPRLTFDGRAGELRFPDDVRIDGDRIEFVGSNALVVMNEGAERLELLRVEHTTSLIIKPGGKPASASPPPTEAQPATPAPPTANPASPAPAAPEKSQTLYAAWCEGSVKVEQGDRVLTGDRLDGWMRLIGNALPPNAIAGAPPRARHAEPVMLATAYVPAQPARTAQPSSMKAGEPDSNPPISLTWTGPLEVRPLKEPAAELQFNDVFMRCTGPTATSVNVRDAKANITATGAMVEYGATKRDAAIAGNATGDAVLEKPDVGRAVGARFEASLATGIATARGAGSLTSAVKEQPGRIAPAAKPRAITWGSEAQFTFGLKQGTMSSRLDRAMLHGGVTAGDGAKGRLSGESLTAEFEKIDEDRSFLKRVAILGKANAIDGNGGSLAADLVDVGLIRREGDSTESDPASIDASGDVRVTQRDGTLRAKSLKAALTRRPDGDVIATTASAKGDVRYDRADGVMATADELAALPQAQQVTLLGETATVGQRGTVISGGRIELDGAKRTLAVPGKGELNHAPAAKAGETPTTAKIAWQQGMSFDDASGLALCDGSAAAEISKGAIARDAIKAEHVRVQLTPAPPEAARGNPTGEKAPERALQSVVATAKDEATPANVEIRRYAVGAAGAQGPLERLMYLEGREILADNAAGTLNVPTAGKLLSLDKRVAAQHNTAQPPTKGTALFTWKESFSLDRRSGQAVMKQGVKLVQERMDDPSRIELECTELTAQVVESTNASTLDAPFAGELKMATAKGSAWMRYQQKEVTGDVLTYDAVSRTVDAQGNNGNFITAFDPATAAPITATRVLWDLNGGKFQLFGIQQPIVTPR
ncbi:MAG: hypothetical protein JSR77_06805 [Planctomycetes bacterium]|nr:hypothetical protein [Planctomycetota bacterium]